LAASQTLSQL